MSIKDHDIIYLIILVPVVFAGIDVLDLTKTGATVHNTDDLVEGSELEPVWSPGEVSDPGDIHTSSTKVVLGSEVGETVELLVTTDASVRAVLWNDETV